MNLIHRLLVDPNPVLSYRDEEYVELESELRPELLPEGPAAVFTFDPRNHPPPSPYA